MLKERLASFELELNGLMQAKEEKCADVFARFAEILVMLRAMGHDLYSWGFDGDIEEWGA